MKYCVEQRPRNRDAQSPGFTERAGKVIQLLNKYLFSEKFEEKAELRLHSLHRAPVAILIILVIYKRPLYFFIQHICKVYSVKEIFQ